jgi:hypothetical protein
MSLSNTTETEVLAYIFDTAAAAWAANGNFYLALHTADPTDTGTAVTSESAYTSYARVAISRTTGFTVSGATAENAALVSFPEATGGTSVVTHFSVVTTSSGAGQIICYGALGASRTITSGITPQFSAGSLVITLD